MHRRWYKPVSHGYNKATNYRRHAKKRALQRYGLDLNRDDIKAIVRRIQTGDVTKSWKQSSSRTKFVMEIKGVECLVVYDKNQHTVVTFLPWRG